MNFLTHHSTFSSFAAQLGTQSFELQARTTMNAPGLGTTSFSTIAVIALVSFVLILFLMATLWPREKSDSFQFRQRQFGRVDGLFYKVQAAILEADEAQKYLSGQLSEAHQIQALMLIRSQPMTLVSLSVGGCAFVSSSVVRKGSLILLQLSSLPDFPATDFPLLCRVVWTKQNKGSHGSMESVGCKFVTSENTPFPEDQLKRYITFLMDEPVS
ncbi:MAG: hypothetical protein RJB13_894 [Pseudomonadota bacterium]